MKCSNCGTEFEGKFCHHCGTPAPSLTADDSAQPLTTPSAPTPKPSPAPTPDDFSTHYDNEYAAQGSPDVDENRHVPDWNTPDSANSPEPQKKGKGCIIAVMVTIVALIIAFLVLLVFIVNGLSNFDLHTSAKVSQYETPSIYDDTGNVSFDYDFFRDYLLEQYGDEAPITDEMLPITIESNGSSLVASFANHSKYELDYFELDVLDIETDNQEEIIWLSVDANTIAEQQPIGEGNSADRYQPIEWTAQFIDENGYGIYVEYNIELDTYSIY